MRFLLVILFLLKFTILIGAREPGSKMTIPIYQEGGDSRIPISVEVGSETPKQLYTPNLLRDRTVLIQNPNKNYDLLIGTWSGFRDANVFWFVPKSSGSWTTTGHGTLWIQYPPGASTETVRGNIERQ